MAFSVSFAFLRHDGSCCLRRLSTVTIPERLVSLRSLIPALAELIPPSLETDVAEQGVVEEAKPLPQASFLDELDGVTDAEEPTRTECGAKRGLLGWIQVNGGSLSRSIIRNLTAETLSRRSLDCKRLYHFLVVDLSRQMSHRQSLSQNSTRSPTGYTIPSSALLCYRPALRAPSSSTVQPNLSRTRVLLCPSLSSSIPHVPRSFSPVSPSRAFHSPMYCGSDPRSSLLWIFLGLSVLGHATMRPELCDAWNASSANVEISTFGSTRPLASSVTQNASHGALNCRFILLSGTPTQQSLISFPHSSNPLPPISRLEASSFSLDASSTADSSLDTTTYRAPILRANLRDALASARAACWQTCGALEPLVSSSQELDTLIEMYTAHTDLEHDPRFRLAEVALASSTSNSPSGRSPKRNTWSAASSPARPWRRTAVDRPLSISVGSRPGSSGGQPSPLSSPTRASTMRNSLPVSFRPEQQQPLFHSPTDAKSPDECSLLGLRKAREQLDKERTKMLCHLLVVRQWDNAAVTAVQALADELGRLLEGIVKVAEDAFGGGCLDPATRGSGAAEECRIPGDFTAEMDDEGDLPSRPYQPSADNGRKYGYAPPPPPGTRSREAIEQFQSKTELMSLALRTMSAKIRQTSTDIRTVSPEDEERLVSVHDSIRGDVETLLRDWDESRAILRRAIDLQFDRERAQPVSRKSEDVDVASSKGGGTSSVFDDSDIVTPVDSGAGSPMIEGATTATMAKIAAAEDDLTTLLLESASADHLPPRGLEQVFEFESSLEGVKDNGRIKLSREERIRLMREKRAQREEEKQEPGERGLAQTGMVDELKGVISELRRRQTSGSAA
jgi:hypothetical protein